MKTLKSLFAILIIFFVSGCGHNLVTTDKGIGMHLKLPLPNGGSLIDVKFGYIDSTSTLVRGNTTVDCSTASGGTGWSLGGGTSQVVLVKTGPQLNEGYLHKVLADPNIDKETKKAVAAYLTNTKQLKLAPTALTVSNGGITTGQNPKEAKSVKDGFDNVVDKISDSYQTTVNSTSKSVTDSITNVTHIIAKYIYYVIAVIGILIVIIIFLIIKNNMDKRKYILNKSKERI